VNSPTLSKLRRHRLQPVPSSVTSLDRSRLAVVTSFYGSTLSGSRQVSGSAAVVPVIATGQRSRYRRRHLGSAQKTRSARISLAFRTVLPSLAQWQSALRQGLRLRELVLFSPSIAVWTPARLQSRRGATYSDPHNNP